MADALRPHATPIIDAWRQEARAASPPPRIPTPQRMHSRHEECPRTCPYFAVGGEETCRNRKRSRSGSRGASPKKCSSSRSGSRSYSRSVRDGAPVATPKTAERRSRSRRTPHTAPTLHQIIAASVQRKFGSLAAGLDSLAVDADDAVGRTALVVFFKTLGTLHIMTDVLDSLPRVGDGLPLRYSYPALQAALVNAAEKLRLSTAGIGVGSRPTATTRSAAHTSPSPRRLKSRSPRRPPTLPSTVTPRSTVATPSGSPLRSAAIATCASPVTTSVAASWLQRLEEVERRLAMQTPTPTPQPNSDIPAESPPCAAVPEARADSEPEPPAAPAEGASGDSAEAALREEMADAFARLCTARKEKADLTTRLAASEAALKTCRDERTAARDALARHRACGPAGGSLELCRGATEDTGLAALAFLSTHWGSERTERAEAALAAVHVDLETAQQRGDRLERDMARLVPFEAERHTLAAANDNLLAEVAEAREQLEAHAQLSASDRYLRCALEDELHATHTACAAQAERCYRATLFRSSGAVAELYVGVDEMPLPALACALRGFADSETPREADDDAAFRQAEALCDELHKTEGTVEELQAQCAAQAALLEASQAAGAAAQHDLETLSGQYAAQQEEKELLENTVAGLKARVETAEAAVAVAQGEAAEADGAAVQLKGEVDTLQAELAECSKGRDAALARVAAAEEASASQVSALVMQLQSSRSELEHAVQELAAVKAALADAEDSCASLRRENADSRAAAESSACDATKFERAFIISNAQAYGTRVLRGAGDGLSLCVYDADTTPALAAALRAFEPVPCMPTEEVALVALRQEHDALRVECETATTHLHIAERQLEAAEQERIAAVAIATDEAREALVAAERARDDAAAEVASLKDALQGERDAREALAAEGVNGLAAVEEELVQCAASLKAAQAELAERDAAASTQLRGLEEMKAALDEAVAQRAALEGDSAAHREREVEAARLLEVSEAALLEKDSALSARLSELEKMEEALTEEAVRRATLEAAQKAMCEREAEAAEKILAMEREADALLAARDAEVLRAAELADKLALLEREATEQHMAFSQLSDDTRRDSPVQDTPPVMPQDPAALIATGLYKAMKGPGTDEDAIYALLGQISSQEDWDHVEEAFAAVYSGFHEGNVVAALRDELTKKELAKAEQILVACGVRLVVAVPTRGNAEGIAHDLHAALTYEGGVDGDAFCTALARVETQRLWKGAQDAFSRHYPRCHGGDVVAAALNSLSSKRLTETEGVLNARGLSWYDTPRGTSLSPSPARAPVARALPDTGSADLAAPTEDFELEQDDLATIIARLAAQQEENDAARGEVQRLQDVVAGLEAQLVAVTEGSDALRAALERCTEGRDTDAVAEKQRDQAERACWDLHEVRVTLAEQVGTEAAQQSGRVQAAQEAKAARDEVQRLQDIVIGLEAQLAKETTAAVTAQGEVVETTAQLVAAKEEAVTLRVALEECTQGRDMDAVAEKQRDQAERACLDVHEARVALEERQMGEDAARTAQEVEAQTERDAVRSELAAVSMELAACKQRYSDFASRCADAAGDMASSLNSEVAEAADRARRSDERADKAEASYQTAVADLQRAHAELDALGARAVVFEMQRDQAERVCLALHEARGMLEERRWDAALVEHSLAEGQRDQAERACWDLHEARVALERRLSSVT